MSHYFSEDVSVPLKIEKISEVILGKMYQFEIAPGVFSSKRIDKGTRALCEMMELKENHKVLDLGCGYGVIGIVASSYVSEVHLRDINKRAVLLTKRNIKLNNIKNASVSQGNLYEELDKFNTILTNPPISSGMDVVGLMIDEAPKHLYEDGNLQLVIRKGVNIVKERLEKNFEKVNIKKKYGYHIIFAS
ncbi:MAG: class I SAM-dependent methyltransferase [Candidatus Methanofastidiosa archaeon]|nr:class I SAM-dependent methyltransferase [Candidatus Methanofastidiosa archaeon]